MLTRRENVSAIYRGRAGDRLLEAVPRGRRFVLGMSDNTPPDADFERVRLAADLVNRL